MINPPNYLTPIARMTGPRLWLRKVRRFAEFLVQWPRYVTHCPPFFRADPDNDYVIGPWLAMRVAWGLTMGHREWVFEEKEIPEEYQ